MPREISSPGAIAPLVPTPAAPNTYKDRLVKLIPSEIVTAYVTLQGLIVSNGKNSALFLSITCICLLVLTPVYLIKVSGVNKKGQIAFTTIGFVIWVMASGGFKIMFPSAAIFEDNFPGSMLLILYTLGIPLFYKG